MSKFAKLEVEGKVYKLPIIKGTENETAIDITNLRSESGLVTLDSGFKNTGAVKSNITFLDGEKGILKHRGYTIEDLTDKSNFLEVSYLLIFQKLPTKDQYKKFEKDVKSHSFVHEDMKNILDGFPSGSHPMGVLSSLVSALTSFHPKTLKSDISEQETYINLVKLIAKLPTIAAWSYKKELGQPINYPDPNLDYCENFLNMMFSKPNQPYKLQKSVARALDKLLILHADHEQNCSTSTVRIVGSSKASLYASISSGISALWGPLHGGANQAVIEMLESIKKDGGDVEKYIAKAKDKNDSFRLMGFGHRVYKNFDPRAKIIKKYADEVLNQLGIEDPILDIAKKLEATALKDSYFVDRKLFPNVDFYSGIIYKAIGIPTEMFTVMFAIGRLPGWIAHFKEMIINKEPIGRPRQIYTGDTHRKYTDIENR